MPAHPRVSLVPAKDEGTAPTYVAFTDEVRLIGVAAMNPAAIDSTNAFFNSERWIGRCFYPSLPLFERICIHAAAKEGVTPRFKFCLKNEHKAFSPKEISGMIFGMMCEIAEDLKIRNAVVTVPAYFNNSQRLVPWLA